MFLTIAYYNHLEWQLKTTTSIVQLLLRATCNVGSLMWVELGFLWKMSTDRFSLNLLFPISSPSYYLFTCIVFSLCRSKLLELLEQAIFSTTWDPSNGLAHHQLSVAQWSVHPTSVQNRRLWVWFPGDYSNWAASKRGTGIWGKDAGGMFR